MTKTPIVDAHIHFWDTGRHERAWLANRSTLNRDILPDQLTQATDDANIQRLVYVETGVAPAERFDEVDWVNEMAKRDSRLAGIVAAAPVELGEICCRAYEALAAKPRVCGIRRNLAGRDDDFCLDPRFIEGIECLAEFGFSFDLCITPKQLPSAIDLVCQCPEIQFVLDHVGKPNIKAGEIDPWESKLEELAQLENCWCKLSGLTTEAATNWQEEDILPYLKHAVKCFGLDRVMFGSDWPIAANAVGYADWVRLVEKGLGANHAEARRRVFHDNAVTFYRLDG